MLHGAGQNRESCATQTMLHGAGQTDMEQERWQRRDRKRKSKEKNARMRGKRSVFEISKAIGARYRRHATRDGTDKGSTKGE